jgi:proteasome accessory factor C
MVEGSASRAIRLLDLVPYLVSHPGISVSALAKEFGVSRDEILKDLNLLFLCGLPGYTPLELIDISFDDEVVVVRDPQNLDSPRNLTESESLALRISLSALLEMTPPSNPMYDKIASLSEKITHAFSPDIPVDSIEFTPDREKNILHTLEKAIRDKLDVRLEYLNLAKDELSLRVVTPEFITLQANRNTLNAYCHERSGIRTFVISQIRSVNLIERKIDSPSESESSDIGRHSIVSIRIKDSQFVERNQKFLSKKDADEYTLVVFDNEWTFRTAVSSPHTLEVLEPLEIRREVRQRALKALDSYRTMAKTSGLTDI